MTKIGTLATRLGIFSVMAAGAVALTTAAPASAAGVSGGWFNTITQCTQSGHNIVDRPGSGYSDYSCKYSASHNPHWHLILYRG